MTMADRLAVVVSRAESGNPAKRNLEEDIVNALIADTSFEVIVIPHVYHLRPESPSLTALLAIHGDVLVFAWLYPRATHWVLDRHGIRGHEGETPLRSSQEQPESDNVTDGGEEDRVASRRVLPPRKIHCLDLRSHPGAEPYVREAKRIAAQARIARENADAPRITAVGIEQPVERRWYPVIDFSRCINCMECIDFCLFGVYGIDETETILVEQPDNCRKGCPACSRVCPENAIMFPLHKTPAIAGDPAASAGQKIDLSQLFGAPESRETALDLAAHERDEHSRNQEVPSAGVAAESKKRARAGEKDELDALIDTLEESDP
jgi:NAD-dependent dihydropyrimidine dehydrogenase PreA subunit